jgi:gamma-carbonic anhydrase
VMIKSIKDKNPNIGESCFIAPNATVLGDVRMGSESSIWFGAVVRGDLMPVIIGERSNVQDLCVLHVGEGFDLKIGDNVTIGHRAIVHGCTIGNNVLIGMGSTIMNGAEIGDGSIVGAGAVVTGGTKVPPNSLVLGMPAKVKRELSKEEIASIGESATHYVEFALRYIEEGICDNS